MRILMLSWEYPPRIVGGISRVVYDIAQQLGKSGNEVHVVTCWEDGSCDIEKDMNVYVHRVHTYEVNTLNFIDWVLQLNLALLGYSARLISETGRFDITHAHDWIVAFCAKSLKDAYGIPVVATIHATENGRNWGIHNDTQRYINNVEWWLCYEAWKVIVNSDYMNREVQRIFQLPADKIKIIPNGINNNKFDTFEKDVDFIRNYAMDNEKIVFFVGRLVNEKGVQVLLDSIPKVISGYNDVKFVIAGKGPLLDQLKEKAAAMNVSGKVYFTGYINDNALMKLYKCSDIAVFPSLYEPFGIVALEGMVAGIPVVVSDTGGLGEIVEHGVDGMKAYNGNANSFADCILELLMNEYKAKSIAKKAAEKVEQYYNWSTLTDEIKQVYEEVISDSRNKSWRPAPLGELLKH